MSVYSTKSTTASATADMRWWFLTAGLAFSFLACQSKSVRRNDVDDIEKGLVTIKRMYVHVKNNKLDSAALLFGPEFRDGEPLMLLNTLRDTIGHLVDVDVDISSSYVASENGEMEIEFRYELDCQYGRGKSREVVSLKGESLDDLHIMGYQCSLVP